MKSFISYHLPAIMFGLAILTLSSMPHVKAPEIGWWAGDKLAHFLEYAVFAFLLHRSFGKLGPPNRSWFAWGATLLFVAIFALIDETWQSFVPGRFSDQLDWLADFSGGAVTVALLILLERRRRPNQP